MENTENKIFNIPKENLPKLQAKVKAIQKKALKLEVEVPHFKVIREWLKEYKVKNKTYQVEMVEVEVDGVKTHLAGWSFLATIDHHDAGNIIRFNPKYEGESNVEKFRTAKPNCDHCQHQRRRKDTFIMINEAGETKQIGRSCIKDFLGHKSAEYYAQMCEFVSDLKKSGSLSEYGGRMEELYSVMQVLEVSAMLIRLDGYRSSKMSGKITSNSLRYWLTTEPADYKEAQKEEMPFPTDEDKQVAQNAFNLAMGFSEQELVNDFNRNLHILCKRGHAVDRDLGMLCYLPEMLMKTIAKQIEEAKRRKAQKELAEKSRYLGQLKERMTLEVHLMKKFWLGESQWGDSYLYNFQDAQGNVIVWKTGNSIALNAGDKVKLVGTVKEHSEYREVKQTVLTRCKIEKLSDPNENQDLKQA